MNNSVVQLQQYQDKCFIMNILCEKSVEYFSLMKNIVSVPLIISSAIMTIMNSGSFSPESMQTPNIVVNACTTIIISFMNNFKLAEKCNTFRIFRCLGGLDRGENPEKDQKISPVSVRVTGGGTA